MKKTLLLASLGCMTVATGYAQGVPAQRSCGSMDAYERLLENDPNFARNRQDIENHAQRIISSDVAQSRAVITIPVVVHVVYNTATQNVSDAQIQSQIDVLNADFRKLNADASLVPSAFAALAADAEIQFCLAKRDPSGNATTGITRTSTTKTSFTTNDGIKSAAQGGKDAWNTTQYLNLWVGNISGGILGYAQFPGGAASTDGVVINYSAFGTMGTAAAPYNKGRTATHEVGHWLNLYHIWGDDGTGCTGSDQVGDTPNQADENYGCPTYPNASCSNTSDMYMNYMDYTDDACMYMFSAGQKARMQALFAAGGARVGLTTSQGCVAPTGVTCGTPASLTATSITTTGATLGWGAVSGASSYNVQYKTSAATTWTTTTSTTTSKALTGLTAGTTYNYQIQAVCTSGSSTYSTASSFSTTAAACSDAYEANNTYSAAKAISNNTNITALIGTSTDVDWFKVTTTTAAPKLQITLTNLPLDYDVQLYSSNGTTLLGSSANGSTSSETIKYNTATAGATYYVKVFGYNSAYSASSCYTLLASTSATAFRLADGAEEVTVGKDATVEAVASLNLYPNPAKTTMTVAYLSPLNQDVNIAIYDMLGRRVSNFAQTMYAGENSFQVNVEMLKAGMYIVEVQNVDGTSRETKKFMVE